MGVTRKTARPKPPPMLHRGEIAARGWTASLMNRYLPVPDATRPNRMSRSAPPVKLWKPETIDAIETTQSFRDAYAHAARRKEAAARAVETKNDAMDAWVDGLEIKLPDIDEAELIQRACRRFNSHQIDRLCDGKIDRIWEAKPDSDPRFIARIAVNYARHEVTSYDRLIESTWGKVGRERAYERIRARVLDAIGAKYPGLKAECERQKGEM